MRILITGGSGFLGRALTKHWRDDHTICVYSRSESAQAKLPKHPNVRHFIGDVRDLERLKWAAEDCGAIVHLAALKRVETCEQNPHEVIATNIDGTQNVIAAAIHAGVEKVLYTSTDKAWNPVGLYGATKLVAEKAILLANNTVRYGRPKFAATRYGNVIGSTGSVVPTWRAATGRVVCADPEATRFWMSLDEAVQLVTRTLDFMLGGELAIPELPAFRLADLAVAMDKAYDVTHLPAWEKRHEGMSDTNTSDKARRMTIDEIRERLKEVE